jgi:hypothetical protein
MNQLLALKVSTDMVAPVARTIAVHSSTGRHKHHDCSQLCSTDVDYATTRGFGV